MTDLSNLRRNSTGKPILGKADINRIGEQIVRDFDPDMFHNPHPLEIDALAEFYLHMIPEFQYLSHCRLYLGMTVFRDTNRIIVYNPEKNKAEYFSAKAHTVIIDNSLLAENQEHPYRFTMGHECSHEIFHRPFFLNTRNFRPMDIVQRDHKTMAVACRQVRNYKGMPDTSLWTDLDSVEWQADYMSSAMLMPESIIKRIVGSYDREYLKDHSCRLMIAQDISDMFNVSIKAAEIRMSEVGKLPKDNLMDFPVNAPEVDVVSFEELINFMV